MKPGPRLAIDFGTTRTKVAYYDTEREQARLVELGISQREIIPSVFYVPRRDRGEILVGDDAMAQIDIDPAGIVREIKREIDKLGKKYVGPGRLTPTRVELAAEMLRTIRRRCEAGVFHGQQIDKCRLTVPVTYTESQRNKLYEAANLAGFNDIQFIDEPTAAARAWVEQQGERLGDHIVVVDVGGGTTDFSVVEWSHNRFRPDTHVLPEGFAQGGNDIDDHACDELLARQSESDQDAVRQSKDSFLVKLRSIKEQFTRGLKRQVMSSGQTSVEVEQDVFHQAEAEFLNRLSEELTGFIKKCRSADINAPIAILVGGASRIAGLQSKVEEICPGKVFVWESADFATVLGAVDYPGNEVAIVTVRERKAQASYTEALKAAISDDRITVSERDYLNMRREQLGLTEETYTGIELKILGAALADIPVIDESIPALQPSDPHVISKAESLVKEQKLEEALECLQIALDCRPNVPEYLLLRSKIYIDQERWLLAWSAANAVIMLSPTLPAAIYYRFLSNFMQRKFDAVTGDLGFLLANTNEFRADVIFFGAAINYQKGIELGLCEDLEKIINEPVRSQPSSKAIAARMILPAIYLKHDCGLEAVLAIEELIKTTHNISVRQRVDAVSFVKLFLEKDFAAYAVQFLENQDRIMRRLLGAHKLIKKNSEQDVGRGFVQSCIAVGASVRYIENVANGNLSRVKGALIESARLFDMGKVPACDVKELLIFSLKIGLGDVIKLREIAGFQAFVQYMIPQLTVTEDHGAFLNFIHIKNESLFTVSYVVVVASIVRADGSQQTETVTHNSLAPGAVHQWDSVFKEPGWFGGNIKGVTLNASCKEGVCNVKACQQCPDTLQADAHPGSTTPSHSFTTQCRHCGSSSTVHLSNFNQEVLCIHCKRSFIALTKSSQVEN